MRPPTVRHVAAERTASARVRSKVWIERGDDVLLSEWRVDLLAAIEASGSLAAAAERVGVPYRTAWERIREMERALGVRLLESASGGAEGGGSRLSPVGAELVARFRRVTDGLAAEVERRFRVELADLLEPGALAPANQQRAGTGAREETGDGRD